MKDKTLLRTILLTLLFNLFAQAEAVAQKTLEETTATFFEALAESPDKALEYARDMALAIPGQDAQWAADTEQIRPTLAALGEYKGYEKMNEVTVGQSYKRLRFLLKYEKAPVVLNLQLYRPKDVWKIKGSQWQMVFEDEWERNTGLSEHKRNGL
ncbi:hypothetical protein [Maribacter sp. 2307ULW6-5]|uniref:hypothetical protein n=1 Tax=Maribacter sp. 2307ULW6-5 TaxID=3386275 RepID=UPI0039BC8840